SAAAVGGRDGGGAGALAEVQLEQALDPEALALEAGLTAAPREVEQRQHARCLEAVALEERHGAGRAPAAVEDVVHQRDGRGAVERALDEAAAAVGLAALADEAAPEGWGPRSHRRAEH